VIIRIEGVDLPGPSCGPSPERPDGHHNIHVAVPRRGRPGELLGLTPASAPSARWELPCTVAGSDVKGPYVQGRPGGRFVYLSWGTVDPATGAFSLFRRAKLLLDAVPPDVLAVAADQGVLVGRVGLTDAKGNPTCAALRPPQVAWRASGS